MAITDILSAKDIKAALAKVKESETFNHKSFIHEVGLTGMDFDQATKVFEILDQNRDGVVDEQELMLFLQNFSSEARPLFPAEIKALMEEADADHDGKMGLQDFYTMIKKIEKEMNHHKH